MTRPNVVLLVMDTARATDVPLSSGTPNTMPTLREFASDGTLFTDAMANASWTLPSHGTLFSGQPPSVHGAHAEHKQFEYGPTLATMLKQEGYRTAAISNNTWISGEFGFERGFDKFVTTWQLFQEGIDFGDVAQTETGIVNQLKGVLRKFRGNPIKNIANLLYGNFFRKRRDAGAKRTNRIIEKNLSEWANDSAPFFLFLNYLEPHIKYAPPDEHVAQFLPEDISIAEARDVNQDAWAYITGETMMTDRDFDALRGLYRGELAYLDERIGELLNQFENAGILDETVFIITGDHGENIGEHGLMDHQYSLYQTLLHVPLVVTGPGFDSGRQVEKPVQLLDLFPTILDIADVTFDPGDYVGDSLRDLRQLPDNRFQLAEYVGPQPPIETLTERYDCKRDISEFNRQLWALKRNGYKYIRGSDGSERLFDLREDPTERTDISTLQPEQYQILADELDKIIAELPENDSTDGEVTMDSETEQRLEDLGYLQ